MSVYAAFYGDNEVCVTWQHSTCFQYRTIFFCPPGCQLMQSTHLSMNKTGVNGSLGFVAHASDASPSTPLYTWLETTHYFSTTLAAYFPCYSPCYIPILHYIHMQNLEITRISNIIMQVFSTQPSQKLFMVKTVSWSKPWSSMVFNHDLLNGTVVFEHGSSL